MLAGEVYVFVTGGFGLRVGIARSGCRVIRGVFRAARRWRIFRKAVQRPLVSRQASRKLRAGRFPPDRLRRFYSRGCRVLDGGHAWPAARLGKLQIAHDAPRRLVGRGQYDESCSANLLGKHLKGLQWREVALLMLVAELAEVIGWSLRPVQLVQVNPVCLQLDASSHRWPRQRWIDCVLACRRECSRCHCPALQSCWQLPSRHDCRVA